MNIGKEVLFEENSKIAYPFHSYMDSVKDSGSYYLSPEICKEISIAVGASGIHAPKAIKKMRKSIDYVGDVMKKVIPAFRFISRDIVIQYAAELAECLVEAAGNGRGLEITIGYPKVFVFKVV